MKGGEPSPPRKPFSKIAWSWLGAFVGIYLVSIISRYTHADLLNSLFLVGSFGATALIAVIGSAEVHNTGYLFVLSPVGAGQ